MVVGAGQRLGRLHRQPRRPPRAIGGISPLRALLDHQVGDGPPVDELHREIEDAAVLAGGEDGHDVGVVQPRGGRRLAAESHAKRELTAAFRRQDLQGYATAQRLLDRLVHHAHPAPADLAHDPERPERHGRFTQRRDREAERRRRRRIERTRPLLEDQERGEQRPDPPGQLGMAAGVLLGQRGFAAPAAAEEVLDDRVQRVGGIVERILHAQSCGGPREISVYESYGCQCIPGLRPCLTGGRRVRPFQVASGARLMDACDPSESVSRARSWSRLATANSAGRRAARAGSGSINAAAAAAFVLGFLALTGCLMTSRNPADIVPPKSESPSYTTSMVCRLSSTSWSRGRPPHRRA